MSSFAMGTIACCLCGASISPNDAAMCLVCLRGQIDVTDGIGRHAEVVQCTKCDRWFSQKDTWVFHEPESPGLMALCLRKVTGLNKVKLIDAYWIWTEPHSKRLKIAIDIEKAVLDDKLTLRQKLEVEYVVKNRQCLECIREASEHTWGSQIQLRQRNQNSSSLIQLESALTKAGMHNLMLSVDVVKYGMNLFFKNKNQAEKVVNFISALLPVRVKSSKKMVSSNKQSNTQKYEYVYMVDVIPLCKHDLVYITKEMRLPSSLSASSSSNAGEFMIVEKLSSSLHLVNPLTLHRIEMTASKYFAMTIPLTAVMNSKQLVSYIVLDLEERSEGMEKISDVTIAKESDLGENDNTYQTTTHLGHLVKAGDAVMGYDISHSTLFSDTELLQLRLPSDVILVKKGATPKFTDDSFNGEKISASSTHMTQSAVNEERDEVEDDEDLPQLGDIIQTAQVESYYHKHHRGEENLEHAEEEEGGDVEEEGNETHDEVEDVKIHSSGGSEITG